MSYSNIIVFQNNAFVIFTHNWKFTGINPKEACQGDAIIDGDSNGI